MGIDSGLATSRRGYLSTAELEQFANIDVTDTAEANDRISQAEEIIDSYVGFQEKFLVETIRGRASGGGSNYIILRSEDLSRYQNGYFVGCEVEIIGGTGAGQRRRVSVSTYEDAKLTVADAWSTSPDNTSMYAINQLGKFPRYCDVYYHTDTTPYTYYRQIPEEVKRAVAAQVEYLINMGDDFFSTDKSQKQSESIASYSYTNAGGEAPLARLIAPKAKMFLRGIKNRLGVME